MPDDLQPLPTPRRTTRRPPLVSSGVLGMAIFVIVEIMFFSGLVSSFLITRASTLPVLWPPPNQPRLPVEATGVNTLVLLASGVLLLLATQAFKAQRARASALALASFVLGATFVLVQGYEWSQLIAEGLRLQTSVHGAFFYVIVGAHALHVIGALCGLGWLVRRMRSGIAKASEVGAMQVLWTFVVVIWPLLYVMIYL